MIDNANYFLNSPYGYPYAEPIAKGDFGNLKRFAIQLSGADEDLQETVRNATHEQLISWFLASKFTFDPEWYGVRELPKNADGTQKSALDDPMYRRRIGIIEKPSLP